MRNIPFISISKISEKYIGKLIITQGTIECVYPIKEDRLKNYIIVDSLSPLQKALYLCMNTSHRTYRIAQGTVSFILLNAPFDLYEGKNIRFLAKVIKYRKSIALKFKKYI